MLSRRLTLQLTPLLDLLLIVIFAQYLEVTDVQSGLVRESRAVQQDLQQSQVALQQAQHQVEVARWEVTEQRNRRLASQRQLEQAVERQRALGETVGRLFNLKPEDVSRYLNKESFLIERKSDSELQSVRDQLRSLSKENPAAVIDHLLTYDEIRKRCDVWRLHIGSGGVLTLNTDDRSMRMRIPASGEDRLDTVNVDQFVNDLYGWYRSLEQPKSLVVVLLTYDPDIKLYLIDGMRQALPKFISRMQTDQGGRTRFEYADLGTRMDPIPIPE